MNVPSLRFVEFHKLWKEQALGDLSQIRTGPFGSVLHQSDYVEVGTPIITVEHLGESGVTYQNLPMVSDQDKARLKSYVLKEGDIVFSRVGSVDRNSLITSSEDGWLFSGRLLRIRTDTSKIYPKYLSFYFQMEITKHRIRSVAVGQTMPSLNTKILQTFTVKFPSIEEQEKIAAFLGAVDAKLEALRRKRALLAKYKRGVMQKLFSQEIRFRQADGSPFPDWETKKLKDLGKFTGGGTPSTNNQEYWQGNTPWISSSDISDESIHDITVSRYITAKAINESATKVVSPNSILLVSRVGVGKLAVSSIEICTSQDFTNFTPHQDNVYFLAYLLHFYKNKLFSFSQGTSIKGFTISDIKLLKLELPHIHEQQKIADFLTAIDDKIKAIDQQVEKMETFKKGLLQQMFV